MRFPSLLLLSGLDPKTAPQAAATDPAPPLPVSSSVLRPPSHGRVTEKIHVDRLAGPGTDLGKLVAHLGRRQHCTAPNRAPRPPAPPPPHPPPHPAPHLPH